MARTLEPPEQAKRILGHRGRKLHTHEIHVRRTANKGYIARHDLRDVRGAPPNDGQRAEMEYSIPDIQALLNHVKNHMDQPAEQDEGQQESPDAELDEGSTEPAE